MAPETAGSSVLKATPHVQKLEGEELVNALRKQLEFYFSRQNLPTDAYLRSQMDARHFVSIDIIAGFRKVKSLTEDRNFLLQVMKQCKNLVVDATEKMVRPNLEVKRTTLILRDIPSTTKLEEIKKIFDDPNCAEFTSIRPEIGDTWFVTFKNQDDCTSTAWYLNTEKKFQGKQIRCRVKSENLFRSLYWPTLPGPGGQKKGGYQGPPHLGKMTYPPFPPMFFQNQHPGLPGQNNDRQQKSKRGKQKNGQRKNQNGQQQKISRNSKKVYIKYQSPSLKYTREQMAEIVRKLTREGFQKPKNLPKAGTSPVIAENPAADSQLLEPMPVMYPASPSPFWAAQPRHSSAPPLLDLSTTPPNHLKTVEKVSSNANPRVDSVKDSKAPTISKPRVIDSNIVNNTKSRISVPKLNRARQKKPGQKKYAYKKVQKSNEHKIKSKITKTHVPVPTPVLAPVRLLVS